MQQHLPLLLPGVQSCPHAEPDTVPDTGPHTVPDTIPNTVPYSLSHIAPNATYAAPHARSHDGSTGCSVWYPRMLGVGTGGHRYGRVQTGYASTEGWSTEAPYWPTTTTTPDAQPGGT